MKNVIEIMKVDELSLHQEALTTPRMLIEQYEALKADIELKGQLDPVLLYRGKIVDGRHRWLILQELNVKEIKVTKMLNNSTIQDIKDIVMSKEMRRHKTISQLAITTYYAMVNSETKLSILEASKLYGVDRRKVSEAKKIAVTYNRPDILELLFNGDKFNTGTNNLPFYTDSLGTILRWLEEFGTINSKTKRLASITPRTELTEDEQMLVNSYLKEINKESNLVILEIINTLYSTQKHQQTPIE